MNRALAVLFAEKENLSSAFRLRMLSIKDKEMDFFMRNLQNVASLAALLAGLAQSGLIYTKYINLDLCGHEEILCSEFTYPLAVTLTMCLALFSMWGCMLVAMLAPGLALRGPQGSMDLCVDMVVSPMPYQRFIWKSDVLKLTHELCTTCACPEHTFHSILSHTVSTNAFGMPP